MVRAFSAFLLDESPDFMEQNAVYINPRFIEMVHEARREGKTFFVYRGGDFFTTVLRHDLVEMVGDAL